MDIFGIPLQAFLGQLLLGLVNGSFYAMLSLGLAVIFGLLGIVNFAHGALRSVLFLGAFYFQSAHFESALVVQASSPLMVWTTL